MVETGKRYLATFGSTSQVFQDSRVKIREPFPCKDSDDVRVCT